MIWLLRLQCKAPHGYIASCDFIRFLLHVLCTRSSSIDFPWILAVAMNIVCYNSSEVSISLYENVPGKHTNIMEISYWFPVDAIIGGNKATKRRSNVFVQENITRLSEIRFWILPFCNLLLGISESYPIDFPRHLVSRIYIRQEMFTYSQIRSGWQG